MKISPLQYQKNHCALKKTKTVDPTMESMESVAVNVLQKRDTEPAMRRFIAGTIPYKEYFFRVALDMNCLLHLIRLLQWPSFHPSIKFDEFVNVLDRIPDVVYLLGVRNIPIHDLPSNHVSYPFYQQGQELVGKYRAWCLCQLPALPRVLSDVILEYVELDLNLLRVEFDSYGSQFFPQPPLEIPPQRRSNNNCMDSFKTTFFYFPFSSMAMVTGRSKTRLETSRMS